MGIFDLTNINFYILVALSIINSVVLCFVSSKLFQMMQLAGYKVRGYNAWLKDTKIKFIGRLIMLSFLSLISVLVTNALFDGFGGYYSYLGLIFYFYFCIVFIINVSKMPQKTPLKQTRRMNRLIITTSIITILITFFMTAFLTEYLPFVKYGVVVLTPLFMPFIVPFANIINMPMEAMIRNGYIKRAKRKLSKMPNLIKIGITGSYGKTTTKHILNVMLSKKYSVCMTPHSFNTPMGLTKVVIKYLKRNNQVLIAEMGAKHVGDIKYLCNLINPKHAIITAVSSQHLLTFGNEDNILKTKNELVEAVDGIAIFNGQNDGAVKLFNKCEKEKFLSGINNPNAFSNVTNLQVSSSGSTFTLTINGESINCTTNLLGIQNIEDIALAGAMAYKLGVSVESISEAISELKPMPHRMELIKSNNLTIIDNAYNSSVESSKASLNVLGMFNGNKIVITPGIVEMGDKEKEANYNFGINMAKVANKVIIVNKVNMEAIKDGLINGGFSEENILFAETLKQAQEMLPTITNSGDVILFENDLPDNYT